MHVEVRNRFPAHSTVVDHEPEPLIGVVEPHPGGEFRSHEDQVPEECGIGLFSCTAAGDGRSAEDKKVSRLLGPTFL